MAKKKVEIEIEYPDCSVCGKGIFDNEEYYHLDINMVKQACHRGDGRGTTGSQFGVPYGTPGFMDALYSAPTSKGVQIFVHSKCIDKADIDKKIIDAVNKLKEEIKKTSNLQNYGNPH